MSTEEQVSFYQARPPRCLSLVSVAPSSRPSVDLDGHGEPVNTFFALLCRHCGATRHAVIGHNCTVDWDGKPLVVFVSPISLRCTSCRAVSPLFDTDRDGYNSVLFGKGSQHRAVGSEVPFVCECGKGEAFVELTARFEYPGDVCDGPEDYEGTPLEDLFSWFTLTGKCAHCSAVSQIADFECA